MNFLTKIFISLFYIGYIKFWPGTFASLLSILILFPIVYFKIISLEELIILFFFIFMLSLIFIKKYSDITNSHDSSVIVIDEFLGIFLIFIFYDYIFIYKNYLTLILIFIFFRFYDIKKIFPANLIDNKMNNSLGVILDDLVAAIYTIITMCVFNAII